VVRLDLQTLVVVLIALSVAIGAPLASISGPRRGTGALWYWAMTLLALASGSLLLVLREIIPPIVSIIFGNALIICSVALLGNTASALTKQFLDGTNRWFFAAISGPVLGLLYLTVDPIWPRVAYVAAVECYLVGQLAWQLRRSRVDSEEPPRKSGWAFEVLLWIFFGETVIRIVSTVALTPAEAFFQQTSVVVAFLLAIVLVAIGTCVLIWHELDIEDSAIRVATSTYIASGLPNQVVFLQLLEGRLAPMAVEGDRCFALLRIRPSEANGVRLDPREEYPVYRNAGTRIGAFLERSDLLARTGDDEFGVVFHGNETERAAQALERALTSLQSKAVVGDRSQYLMYGTAALITCRPSIGAAAEIMKILREGVQGATMGEVRVLT